MDNLTTDLLSRIETLEARLRILEATGSPAADAATRLTAPEHIGAEPSSRRDSASLWRRRARCSGGGGAGFPG